MTGDLLSKILVREILLSFILGDAVDVFRPIIYHGGVRDLLIMGSGDESSSECSSFESSDFVNAKQLKNIIYASEQLLLHHSIILNKGCWWLEILNNVLRSCAKGACELIKMNRNPKLEMRIFLC